MRVSGLTSGGDWRFGKGRAAYKRKSEAIRQNVVTRLRSFTDDWFADVTAGVPWIELFGARGNLEDRKRQVLREVERTVLTTEGVRAIDQLELVEIDENRSATIRIKLIDIFDETINETVTV